MAYTDKDIADLVPHGLVVTRSWLMEHEGLERHTLDNWLKSEKLTALTGGVYYRPDSKLTWQGLVCSLQHMQMGFSVGGLTAFDLHGMAHYLNLGEQRTIHLYGNGALPTWLNKALPDTFFKAHNSDLLFGGRMLANHHYDTKSDHLKKRDPMHDGTFTEIGWGLHEYPLTTSTLERAFFEVLMDVPKDVSFEHADQLMQGLTTLSPRRLQKLLAMCDNIKVRRLFLWFAERHNHSWYKHLDLEHYTMDSDALGSGKRMLVRGGRLDPKYLITVPKDMYQLRVSDE